MNLAPVSPEDARAASLVMGLLMVAFLGARFVPRYAAVLRASVLALCMLTMGYFILRLFR